MRLANLAGRLIVGHPDDGFVDLALASEGRFETHPQLIYERWDEFLAWSADASLGEGAELGAEAWGRLCRARVSSLRSRSTTAP